MKKLLFVFGFLFFTVFTHAQIVSIPDANFKTALLNYTPVIDTNSDGEIQVSEALSVTSLTIINNDFSDITGINSFSNLTSLEFTYIFSLTTLNVTGLTNLQSLTCIGNGHLTTLNVSGLTNLQSLDCSSCSYLTTLNVSGLTNLQTLTCTGMYYLTTLDVSGLISLQTLNCSNDQLTSLITTGANNITNLDCSRNKLTSLVVTNMSNLQVLNCSYQTEGPAYGLTTLDLTGLNALTTIDCTNNRLTALNVSNLTNLTSLSCGSNQLVTLNVAPLINLTSLFCRSNFLTALNVAPLIHLTNLQCDSNQLTTLYVAPLIQLTVLDCAGNLISSIDVSNLTNLTLLYCYSNPLSVLNVNALTNLTKLNCSSNNLTMLDVSNLINLQELNCSSNNLTTIDLQNQTNLNIFEGQVNLFTTLDFSHIATTSNANYNFANLNFYNNSNLSYVNFKNDILNENNFVFHAENCPELQYICANENILLYVINKLQLQDCPCSTTISSNVQVNSYCSFVPVGNHNTITGNLTFDINNNGCGINDISLNHIKVFINDGVDTGAAFTNATGNYTFYSQTGNFAITPNFENPFFTVSPTNATLTFADNNNNMQTQNFCITSLGIHNDLEVVLIPITQARPGFDASYRLVYKNKGNQVQSGSINLNFNDAVLDFVSANPMTTSQSLNNLNWDFTNLNPFESRTIDFVLNVNSPMETPPVNINDLLSFMATISPIQNDETPEDNVSTLSQTVIGSFDPNNKTCVEGNIITPDMVGDYLDYVIRFQNSGTAAAQNIVVKDIIDTAKFDINTLQLTSSSHPNVARITGNKVEFIFENINLPAEVDNEPGSHGYVAFKIKTKNNLVLGNTIQNTANIYFDYNFPIVTNTTSTIVAVLHVNNFENNSVAIAPIPVVDILQIKALENITRVQLFDIQGRLLQTQLADSTTTTLDFSGKSKGVYLVKVQTEKGIKVQKVIKE